MSIMKRLFKEAPPKNTHNWTEYGASVPWETSMSKTAKGILMDKFSDPELYISAMHEFAAHEVEEYKKRLKDELQSRVNGTRGLEHLSFEDISEIIDTVK